MEVDFSLYFRNVHYMLAALQTIFNIPFRAKYLS